MEAIDFTKLFTEERNGLWIAVSSDHTKVYGTSDSLVTLKKEMDERGEQATYIKKPSPDERNYMTF